ncbi:DUF4350 domain-containing protein [Hymenobacter sp. B81]|uniref:DUF4350 domain-containing protein n=1 Tax=Hymenobacter sp. B81 TaxID=3344878 RepID=UPI0037DDC1BC
MLRSIRWPLAVLGVLLLVWALAAYYAPAPLDWTPSYRSDYKKPLGTYALLQLLPSLGSRPPLVVREPPYNVLADSLAADPGAYLLVQDEFRPDAADARALHRYLQRGGTVWLAANDIRLGRAADSLWQLPRRTDLSERLTSPASRPDSLRISLTAPELRGRTAVLPAPLGVSCFAQDSLGRLQFAGPDSLARAAAATVLAVDQRRRPVLVHLPVGRGRLFVCTVPALLSNFGLLYRRNADLAAGALAYLPPSRKVVWDEYYKQGREGDDSLLRVVAASPALAWAWYGLLGGGLLFALFGARRRQRPVPTLRALPNTTLQFVRTVANLYRQGRNHQALAELRIRLFFDYLRTRFQEPFTDPADPDFQLRLSVRTGVPLPEIQSLTGRLNHLLTGERVSEAELQRLNQLLIDFRRRAES